MQGLLLSSILTCILYYYAVDSCLITNCPRGGKRGSLDRPANEQFIRQCISCGPQRSGQCFGPAICCGPFGCLIATAETTRCERDGAFHEREPCIAGKSSCRGDTGRCAFDGICCTQESCYMDAACIDERHHPRNTGIVPLDSLFSILKPYQQNVNYPSVENVVTDTK